AISVRLSAPPLPLPFPFAAARRLSSARNAGGATPNTEQSCPRERSRFFTLVATSAAKPTRSSWVALRCLRPARLMYSEPLPLPSVAGLVVAVVLTNLRRDDIGLFTPESLEWPVGSIHRSLPSAAARLPTATVPSCVLENQNLRAALARGLAFD